MPLIDVLQLLEKMIQSKDFRQTLEIYCVLNAGLERLYCLHHQIKHLGQRIRYIEPSPDFS